MKIRTQNMYRGVCGFKTTLPTNYTPSKIHNQTYTKTQYLCWFDSIFSPLKMQQYGRLSLGVVD